jgi:hypothetical protein
MFMALTQEEKNIIETQFLRDLHLSPSKSKLTWEDDYLIFDGTFKPTGITEFKEYQNDYLRKINGEVILGTGQAEDLTLIFPNLVTAYDIVVAGKFKLVVPSLNDCTFLIIRAGASIVAPNLESIKFFLQIDNALGIGNNQVIDLKSLKSVKNLFIVRSNIPSSLLNSIETVNTVLTIEHSDVVLPKLSFVRDVQVFNASLELPSMTKLYSQEGVLRSIYLWKDTVLMLPNLEEVGQYSTTALTVEEPATLILPERISKYKDKIVRRNDKVEGQILYLDH